jgi:sugar O-acyltransferase (sialic acid O-acetyltransferase NeuD family)
MPLLRAQYPQAELLFVDDGQEFAQINGHRVVTWPQFIECNSEQKYVSIAIASSNIRQRLAERCAAAKIRLVEARASSVVQMDDVVLKEGACLSPFVTLTSNIRVGRCFHANLYSYIEHDCVVGDFVTLAPGAKVNGNVTIGNNVYIGSGAIIRQGCRLGDGAIVGMGAVVLHDVAPGVTVVGNPARPLVKE